MTQGPHDHALAHEHVAAPPSTCSTIAASGPLSTVYAHGSQAAMRRRVGLPARLVPTAAAAVDGTRTTHIHEAPRKDQRDPAFIRSRCGALRRCARARAGLAFDLDAAVVFPEDASLGADPEPCAHHAAAHRRPRSNLSRRVRPATPLDANRKLFARADRTNTVPAVHPRWRAS